MATPAKEFPGHPRATSHGIARWTFYPIGTQLLDGVEVGVIGWIHYENPAIAVQTGIRVESGHVFCFEKNLAIPPSDPDKPIVVGVFFGQSHASYDYVGHPADGLQLLLAVAKYATESLPVPVAAVLQDASRDSLLAMHKSGRLSMSK